MTRLEELHEQLQAHFELLRADRDSRGEGKPIFALEHGLDEEGIAELQEVVRSAVLSTGVSASAWLPYVVYAAEVGYRYDGEEYWQTFENSTPGWWGDDYRQALRRRFRKFADSFGGARPSGAWARHFSIIAWPITHAILPTDLQLQLARLLYDYRLSLTRELLFNPDELGATLAAGAWGGSSRFQVFAQNESLLGQVSSALLLGAEESSSLLLPSTLRRILGDLSAERHARRWLRDAVRTAVHIRTHGVVRGGGQATPSRPERAPTLRPPELMLVRAAEDAWDLWIELPDLSSVTQSNEHLTGVLSRRRCAVAGVSGAPMAPRRVLFPSQQLRFSEWPGWDVSLLSLEGGDPRDNTHLAELVRMPQGPIALFDIVEGLGREVRGKQVRPGRTYIVLSAGELSMATLPIQAVSLSVSGVHAYQLIVPAVVDASVEESLEALGLSLAADIRILPSGLVPAGWNGEGHLEYAVGDRPIISITSSRLLEYCVVAIDDEVPTRVPWPNDRSEPLFLAFEALQVGPHTASFTFVPTGSEERAVEEEVRMTVKEPGMHASGGTVRQALTIVTHPDHPSLDDLWMGAVSIEILGPQVPLRAQVALEGPDNRALIRQPLQGLTPPVDPRTWDRSFANQIKSAPAVANRFDEAVAAVIDVSHEDLGQVTLTVTRAFTPLRWATGVHEGVAYVRLIDNLGERPVVSRYAFDRPDRAIPIDLTETERFDHRDGGLITAAGGGFSAATILAPDVRNLEDLRRARSTPVLTEASRTLEGVHARMSIAKLWADAVLPGNPLATILRGDVIRELHRSVCGVICGPRWSSAEGAAASGPHEHVTRTLAAEIGQQQRQRELIAPLTTLTEGLAVASLGERVTEFKAFLNRYAWLFGRGVDDELTEGLLRLASSPETLMSEDDERSHRVVALALQTPLFLRVARFFVLATASQETRDISTTAYEGWEWW